MKTIAMIPTYNEAGTIESLMRDIRSLPDNVGVLVVDDNSPDGTAAIVERIASMDPKVQVLLRRENRGRGWAGRDGFKKALDLGADYIIEMDGDGSHAPAHIHEMITAAKNADVVIGSRYCAGGSDEQRTLLRRVVSTLARTYLALVLGVKVGDPTSGFRLFKRAVIEAILPHLHARDPFTVTEVLYWVRRSKYVIKEVPIQFLSRGAGESKLKPWTLFIYLIKVVLLRLKNI